MTAKLLDADAILSCNEQWMRLEEEWGKPVDLETEDDVAPSKLQPVYSTLDLRKSTFDSSFLFRKVHNKVKRHLSKNSVLDYKEFLQDLERDVPQELPAKQFYFISGQILSAFSVEEICDKIDDIFKSVEQLCAATSTVRHKKKVLPEIVQCSISTSDLSFDDTNDSEKEKSDEDIDGYIDEAFAQLNSTLVGLSNRLDDVSRGSVTSLVNKFTTVLNSPAILCSPRRQRECSNRFKELADFWKNRGCD